ncbi:MAG TPA: ATP-binding cassette domain-containing protein [Candidatus Binatia bacterium]|nr:ATP-binding cassette domain-containing protein [Candidatus Binatia bacterium]
MSLIEVAGLTYTYADGTQALRGVDLEVGEGEFVAFIGQNGSGKTTLSKCLAGLLRPTAGRVVVDGVDTSGKGVTKELARRIGYVFQNPDHQLFNSRVADEIAYGPRNLGLPDEERERVVQEAAGVAGVRAELFDEHPFFLTKGLRQRVAIASTLAMRPKAIIVDEPTTGQDHRQSVEIMEFLVHLWRIEGHTIVIVTHEMPIVAAYAQRVVALCQGRILLDGPTREVFAQSDALRQTFVKPPQATRLAQAWRDLGVAPDVLSVEELHDSVAGVLASRVARAAAEAAASERSPEGHGMSRGTA